MGRDIRIEEVQNGYVLRAWEVNESAGMIHAEPMKEAVASSKEQALVLIGQWLDKKAPPFKTSDDAGK